MRTIEQETQKLNLSNQAGYQISAAIVMDWISQDQAAMALLQRYLAAHNSERVAPESQKTAPFLLMGHKSNNDFA